MKRDAGKPKLLTFTSTHGGTGQTALCAHVALGLARSGLNVLFVELQVPSVASHYLPGDERANHATAPVALDHLATGCRQVQNGLWHLCLDPGNAAQLEELRRLAGQNVPPQTWLIVDAPRHLQIGSMFSIRPDVEVRVLRADPASLVDTSAIEEAGAHVKLVVNQIDNRRPVSRAIDQVLSTMLDDRLAARIHYDEAVAESLALRTNVFDSAPTSSAARAFTNLVDHLIAAESPVEPILTSRSVG